MKGLSPQQKENPYDGRTVHPAGGTVYGHGVPGGVQLSALPGRRRRCDPGRADTAVQRGQGVRKRRPCEKLAHPRYGQPLQKRAPRPVAQGGGHRRLREHAGVRAAPMPGAV